MCQKHPDIHLLTEFSAGSLSVANSLAISTHLCFCRQCRQHVEKLNAIGASVLSTPAGSFDEAIYDDTPAPSAVSSSLKDRVFSTITQQAEPAASTQSTDKTAKDCQHLGLASRLIEKLLPTSVKNIAWKSYGSSFSVFRIPFVDPKQTDYQDVSLVRIKAGGRIAPHDHTGNEMTVVLSGSFSDEHAVYGPGDFLIKAPGQQHTPVASSHEDCICLTVVDSPIKFTGPIARLFNPILWLKPFYR